MTTFAQVYDGTAHNIVEGPTLDDAIAGKFSPDWVANEAAAGHVFTAVPDGTMHGAKDNGDGTFSNPAAPAAPIPQWNALDFKRRFTSAERIIIRAAAASNGAVYDFLDLLDTAAATGTMIHANDVDVVSGLTAFEGAGFIAAGRKDIILGNGPSP